MEDDGRPSNHPQNTARLPNTIHTKTATAETKSTELPFSNTYIRRNDQNTANNGVRRCNRESSRAKSQLPIYSILARKKRRHRSSDIQSQSPERVHRHETVQANKYVPGSKLSTSKRLAVQDRPVPGILSSPNSKVAQMLPSTSLQKRAVRNEVPAIRPQYSTEDLCHPHKLDRADPKTTRHQNDRLPRRLLDRKSRFDGFKQSHKNSDRKPTQIRLENKRPEVYSCASKSARISRNHVVSMDESNSSSAEERSKDSLDSINSYRQKKRMSERARKLTGTPQFCKFCRTKRQAKLSRTTKTAQVITRKQATGDGSPNQRSTTRLGLVAPKLPQPCPSPRSVPRPLPDNGCVRHCLGSDAGRSTPLRSLDCRGTTPSQQPKRNVGRPKILTRSLSNPETKLDTNTERQQNSGCVPAQRRWNQVCSPNGTSLQNIPDSGLAQNPLLDSSLTWNLQHRIRRAVQAPCTTGMASTSRGYSKDFCQVGNPRDRPVRIEERSCSPDLRDLRPERSKRDDLQCSSKTVELPLSVGLSTTILNSESTGAYESSCRNIPAGGPSLGTRVLESRPSESSNSTPVHCRESATSSPRCHDQPAASGCQGYNSRDMEMWGWSEALRTWTEEQKQLLRSSWRPSTLNTYKPAWARWTRWCQTNRVKTSHPSGSDVARYLADLHNIEGLAYNTILVHKSVISTFCNSEQSSRLSSHILVKQVLKSIALKKPKEPKPPIWDISQVSNHLSQRSLDSNLYDTSRHTAVLLLLCSGRRVHDLTLLRCNSDNLVRSENYITLWPAYGSKTDKSNQRQSGWRLNRNKLNKSLDPIYWVDRLITLSQERRTLAKTDNLFLRTCGAAEAATRTVIAGWVRSVLKDAGISATPGSVRAAVASKNWAENFPIDDILARGNWRSSDTFRKFYQREVLPTVPNAVNQNTAGLFTPVD